MRYGWVRWLYFAIFVLAAVVLASRQWLSASVNSALTNVMFVIIAGTALAVTAYQQWQRRNRDRDQG